MTNVRGECGADQPLSGYYFREARFLRTLRLTLDGETPWLCESAVAAPDVLGFTYVHPELTKFGGGGSGMSGDTVETNAQGIPYRALDIRARSEVGIAELRVAVDVTNHARREVTIELAWELGADFADIQEAQGQDRQQEAPVRVESTDAMLTYVYAHEDLPYRTRIDATGAGEWPEAHGVGPVDRLRAFVDGVWHR